MGNDPPSICMEASSLRRKHGEGVKNALAAEDQ